MSWTLFGVGLLLGTEQRPRRRRSAAAIRYLLTRWTLASLGFLGSQGRPAAIFAASSTTSTPQTVSIQSCR